MVPAHQGLQRIGGVRREQHDRLVVQNQLALCHRPPQVAGEARLAQGLPLVLRRVNGKAAAGAFVLDGHAIAEPKTGGILDRDLPLVGVPVRDQVGLETITGGQDRLARFTDQADVGAQS